MASVQEVILTRPLGQFPVSIATSLAFEGLLGIHPDNPPPKNAPLPYLKYDMLHINVRTLIRNCFTSMKADDAYTLEPYSMCEVVAEEMILIKNIAQVKFNDSFKVSFFIPSYEQLANQFPDANLREANTSKQQFYNDLENKTYAMLIKHPVISELDCELVSLRTRIGRGRALMLTSYPVDILVARYSRYSILESHTGHVRQQTEMTNKLKGTKSKNIPFDIAMLQYFGDSGDMFTPQPIKYRRVLESVAEKNRWNQTTTEAKIKSNLRASGEPHLYEYIVKLYKAPKGR